jgi:hypothetical protein
LLNTKILVVTIVEHVIFADVFVTENTIHCFVSCIFEKYQSASFHCEHCNCVSSEISREKFSKRSLDLSAFILEIICSVGVIPIVYISKEGIGAGSHVEDTIKI